MTGNNQSMLVRLFENEIEDAMPIVAPADENCTVDTHSIDELSSGVSKRLILLKRSA